MTEDRRLPAMVAKRLLLIATEFPPGPGGIGTHAFEVARHLHRLDWNVRVLAQQDYASSEQVAEFNSAQPFTVLGLYPTGGRLAKTVGSWRTVSRQIREWRPEVVVASGDPAVYALSCRRQAASLPTVAVNHGRIPGGWERKLLRWAYGRASAVVFVSRYTRDRMLAAGVRPMAVWVMPNGADASTFRVLPTSEVSTFRESLRLPHERLIATVGNVSHRKGQEVVIQALPKILDEAPDVVYLIAGLPTRQPSLQALAKRLGVEQAVRFLGRIDQPTLVRLLNAIEVFVMTSRRSGIEFEGFGIAVVEAALCGKPAIVSRGSGLIESIVEGETGLAVPENDPEGTADAVLVLLSDLRLQARMGNSARARASAELTWGERVKDYDSRLRSLLPL